MNDLNLGYDVCNIWLQHPTDVAEYRAQEDNGDCTTAFDENCVDALQKLANSEAAHTAFSVPVINMPNSSAAALPTVCTKIGNKIKTSFPKECKKYFKNYGLWAAPMTNYHNTTTGFYAGADWQHIGCDIDGGKCLQRFSYQVVASVDGRSLRKRMRV